jgi:hypothetical protein
MGIADPEQRVSIWRRMSNQLGRNGSICSRSVLHDNGLTPLLRQRFANEARKSIGRTARRLAYIDRNRSFRKCSLSDARK